MGHKKVIPSHQSAALTRPPTLPDYITQQENHYVIDPARLPVPENSYDANVAWTVRDGLALNIFFGRYDPTLPDKLESRVQLVFSIDNYYNLFANCKDFLEKLSAYLSGLREKKLIDELRPEVSERLSKLEPKKVFTQTATLCVGSQTGTETCLDFFCLPAGDVYFFQKYNNPSRLRARPVLRMTTTSDVVELLFRGIEKYAKEVQPLVSAGVLAAVEKADAERASMNAETTP